MNNDGSNVVRINFEGISPPKISDEPSPQELLLSKKKHFFFNQWLQQGTVSVLFDARLSDVKVPEIFKDKGDLRLNFCYQFHIPDFSFNQKAVWASLSFPQGEFFCQVPWRAVYALHSLPLNKGSVWFSDFPKDLDQMMVLGFSDDGSEVSEEEDEVAPVAPQRCSVISIDTLRKKNIVDDMR